MSADSSGGVCWSAAFYSKLARSVCFSMKSVKRADSSTDVQGKQVFYLLRIWLHQAHFLQFIILGSRQWATKCLRVLILALAYGYKVMLQLLRACMPCYCRHSGPFVPSYRSICTLHSISSQYTQHTSRTNTHVPSLSTWIMLLPELAASLTEDRDGVHYNAKILHRHESHSSRSLLRCVDSH